MNKVSSVKVVFVVLCYKNSTDVVNLLESLKRNASDYKVVIVNSFYDEASEDAIRKVSTVYNCDFLAVPNKGYGFGNNSGVKYALENYIFNYLCICNPDITFMSCISLSNTGAKPCIIAPKIVTTNGKSQNPYYLYRCGLVERLKAYSSKKKCIEFYYLAVLVNKIIKLLSIIRHDCRIYACHGACLFIEYDAVLKLLPIYNDEMFLFNEEEHLARKAKLLDIQTFYHPEIIVVHNENGSSDELIKSGKELDCVFDSYRILTDYWKRKSNNVER